MVYAVSQKTSSDAQLACWQTSDNRRLSIRIPQTSDFFNDPAFSPQNIGSERKTRSIDNKTSQHESDLEDGQEEKR